MNKPIKIKYTSPNSVCVEAIDERGLIVSVWVDNSCSEVSVNTYIETENK